MSPTGVLGEEGQLDLPNSPGYGALPRALHRHVPVAPCQGADALVLLMDMTHDYAACVGEVDELNNCNDRNLAQGLALWRKWRTRLGEPTSFDPAAQQYGHAVRYEVQVAVTFPTDSVRADMTSHLLHIGHQAETTSTADDQVLETQRQQPPSRSGRGNWPTESTRFSFESWV